MLQNLKTRLKLLKHRLKYGEKIRVEEGDSFTVKYPSTVIKFYMEERMRKEGWKVEDVGGRWLRLTAPTAEKG